ncbi:response regulator transcription factor [Niastella caeni]|uniref:Response regulator transcription factor n=1 Tax=Niastella caeni TaxID=2569763 RepID=A0A4S8H6F2_9BACT|nr:response regulator [Niastella caeni]THU30370.1 response regulator transcription factor [Niastella caeni]
MKKVMIIEDDEAILDALSIIFTRAGYETSGFINGNFLLEGEFDIPDLFVIDKLLLGVDGLDICKYLKGLPATQHLPIIILSATPYLQEQVKRAGADGYLEKPFSNNNLLQLAEDLLNGTNRPLH